MTPTKIIAAAITVVLMVTPAVAQGTKVAIGISGWTGFAPTFPIGWLRWRGVWVTASEIEKWEQRTWRSISGNECQTFMSIF